MFSSMSFSPPGARYPCAAVWSLAPACSMFSESAPSCPSTAFISEGAKEEATWPVRSPAPRPAAVWSPGPPPSCFTTSPAPPARSPAAAGTSPGVSAELPRPLNIPPTMACPGPVGSPESFPVSSFAACVTGKPTGSGEATLAGLNAEITLRATSVAIPAPWATPPIRFPPTYRACWPRVPSTLGEAGV